MIMSGSRGTLGFLIYALLVQCSASSPLRLETAAYDEDGTSLADLAFDSEQLALRSSPSETDDVYEIYSPSEKRTERHADGMFNKAYRQKLGQLSARKYLATLMAKRVGGGSAMEEADAPAKRHSDGVFTDSYSRYRKQMAVRKYLAAVLGKSPEDLDLHQFLQGIDIGALPDGDEFEAFMRNCLMQFIPNLLIGRKVMARDFYKVLVSERSTENAKYWNLKGKCRLVAA